MPQERYPQLTTSISGIAPEEWKAFHDRARLEGLTKKEALEHAVQDLVVDRQRGEEILWKPPKAGRVAPPRPVKIHDDALGEARKISSELGLRINIIIGTAIQRWTTRP